MKWTCNVPPIMFSVEIDIAKYLTFILGNKPEENCIEMCSCGCTKHGNISFITIDCSSKNLSIFPVFLLNDTTNVSISANRVFSLKLWGRKIG